MAKKGSILGQINRLTYDKPALNKKALEIKKSFDEVNKALNSKKKKSNSKGE